MRRRLPPPSRRGVIIIIHPPPQRTKFIRKMMDTQTDEDGEHRKQFYGSTVKPVHRALSSSCPTNPIVFTFYCSSFHHDHLSLSVHSFISAWCWCCRFDSCRNMQRTLFMISAFRYCSTAVQATPSFTTHHSPVYVSIQGSRSSCIDMSNHTVDGVMWMIKLPLVRQRLPESQPSEAFEWSFNHYDSWRFLCCWTC